MLLAVAMLVLVVDTSLISVSIAPVVHDLGTTVRSIQSSLALEAFVSAAFVLIGSKFGYLIGRKRAYVLGLLAAMSSCPDYRTTGPHREIESQDDASE